MPFFLLVKCIIPRENMSPFLTCFPRLLSAKPFGWGHTRLSHIKRRRLIMPLVALVQKNQSAPATSCSHLVLGTRYGRRRCSSKLRLRTSECLYKNPLNQFLPKHYFCMCHKNRRQMRDVFCVCLQLALFCTFLKTRYCDA